MKNIILCFFLILSPVGSLLGQQKLADSLAQEASKATGKEKVDLIYRLSDVYQYINTQRSIDYANQALKLADSLNYKKGIAGCYGNLGYSYINIDTKKAIEYTKKALQIREELGDKAGIGTSLNVLGVIYYYIGEYIQSIDYHLKAIEIREKVGNEERTATSYNNIALVHMALSNYDTALDYLNKALQVRIKTNNKRGIGIIKTNIGDIYTQLSKPDKALEYYLDALRINREIGTQKSEAGTLFSLAALYKSKGNINEAINYYNKSLDMYRKVGEKNGIANCRNGLAELYKDKNQIDLAVENALEAYKYAVEINSLENISRSSNVLQYCYKQKGDYEKAYNYLMDYQAAHDSIKSDNKLKRLAKIELDYKLNKITQEQEAKLNRQNLYIQFLIVFLVFAAVIVALILKGLRTKKLANNQLNELYSKLKEVNTTKDKFFSILAHDLRAPYQTLLGLTNFMIENIDELDKNEIIESLKSMDSSLHRQFGLLNELLQWSELQSGRFELKQDTILLHDCAEEVIDTLKLTAVQKGIQIKNEVDPKVKVYADENMLKLVIRNLISNGIKFTSKDGCITVNSDSETNPITVTIEDDGVGMSEETLMNLFRMDVHKTHTGTANEKGTGLGLVLCKDIIEKHGGTISAGSREGKGSKFSFTIPSQYKT